MRKLRLKNIKQLSKGNKALSDRTKFKLMIFTPCYIVSQYFYMIPSS